MCRSHHCLPVAQPQYLSTRYLAASLECHHPHQAPSCPLLGLLDRPLPAAARLCLPKTRLPHSALHRHPHRFLWFNRAAVQPVAQAVQPFTASPLRRPRFHRQQRRCHPPHPPPLSPPPPPLSSLPLLKLARTPARQAILLPVSLRSQAPVPLPACLPQFHPARALRPPPAPFIHLRQQ